MFYRQETRAKIKAGVTGLPINSIWTRIEGFGSTSTASAIQKYVRACQDLHSLKNVAIVPEKAGTAGHALVAFGAASGIECGVSNGEAFHFNNLKREPKPDEKVFAAHRQIYVNDLGLFLPPKDASVFFGNRALRGFFGCRNAQCCRRGVDDMIQNPRRHFIISRMLEIDHLSRIPPDMRPQAYLDEFLRPATDRASRALSADLPEALHGKIEKTRRRLDGWRATLGEMAQQGAPQSYAAPVERRVHRLEKGA
jgi:hypothetical protein